MQQTATSQPSPSVSSFAGLLATLASPQSSPPSDAADAPLWNSSDLGEDVVSLSYEQALRARARYRSTYRSDGSPMPPGGLSADAVADAVMESVAAEPVPA